MMHVEDYGALVNAALSVAQNGKYEDPLTVAASAFLQREFENATYEVPEEPVPADEDPNN